MLKTWPLSVPSLVCRRGLKAESQTNLAAGGEVAGLPMQKNHSDCSRLAQHVLVLGSSDYVQPDPTVPAQPSYSTIQSDSTHESVKPKSTCLAPRASAMKEQGFSEGA